MEATATVRQVEPVYLYDGALTAEWFPRQSVLVSILLHVALFSAVLIIANQPRVRLFSPELNKVSQEIPKNQVLYLPDLSIGPPNRSAASAGSETPGRSTETSKSGKPLKLRSPLGLAYHGPQVIISNPAIADNHIQTIKRPDLINAPILRFDVQAPSVVQISTPKVALSAPEPVVAPPREKPIPEQVKATATAGQTDIAIAMPPPIPLQTTALPHVTVPLTGKLEEPPKRLREAAPEPAVPTPARTNLPQAPAQLQSQSQPQQIVVVNAVPISAKLRQLPDGERHGSFMVSPAATSGGSTGTMDRDQDKDKAESTVRGLPAAPVSGGDENSGKKAGSTKSESGADSGKTGSGKKTGGKNGSNGTGIAAAGRGSASSGSGKRGDGSPNGSANGTPSSDELVIVGGGQPGVQRSSEKGKGDAGGSYSYDLTIVGNGSNGGVGNYGVFRDETVYTVYISMEDGPDWTMQYALLQAPVADQRRQSAANVEWSGILAAPTPVIKHPPNLTPEMKSRYNGSNVIVSGVIDLQGKFTKGKVVHSPSLAMNPAVLESLAQWEFRPAQMDGHPVETKLLVSVPITR